MEYKLAIFEEKEIRNTWKENKLYFSTLDVVYVLTDSNVPKQYIKLKSRDNALQNNCGTICNLLEMPTKDGKKERFKCVIQKEY